MKAEGIPFGIFKDPVIELYVRELCAVHEAFDDMGVPREENGEKLSLAQRATVVARELEVIHAGVARIAARFGIK